MVEPQSSKINPNLRVIEINTPTREKSVSKNSTGLDATGIENKSLITINIDGKSIGSSDSVLLKAVNTNCTSNKLVLSKEPEEIDAAKKIASLAENIGTECRLIIIDTDVKDIEPKDSTVSKKKASTTATRDEKVHQSFEHSVANKMSAISIVATTDNTEEGFILPTVPPGWAKTAVMTVNADQEFVSTNRPIILKGSIETVTTNPNKTVEKATAKPKSPVILKKIAVPGDATNVLQSKLSSVLKRPVLATTDKKISRTKAAIVLPEMDITSDGKTTGAVVEGGSSPSKAPVVAKKNPTTTDVANNSVLCVLPAVMNPRTLTKSSPVLQAPVQSKVPLILKKRSVTIASTADLRTDQSQQCVVTTKTSSMTNKKSVQSKTGNVSKTQTTRGHTIQSKGSAIANQTKRPSTAISYSNAKGGQQIKQYVTPYKGKTPRWKMDDREVIRVYLDPSEMPGQGRKKKIQQSLACEECGKTFTRAWHMQAHQLIHAGIKPYECHLCGKAFCQKGNLTTHLRSHAGIKLYKCHLCSDEFSAPNCLSKHIKLHTGEKNFECQICGKRFTAKGDLVVHARTHTGEKPYTCDVCGKRFASKTNMTSHYRIHTDDKRHTCDVCGKRFIVPSHLADHMHRHTGEKPFSCDICKKSYASRRNLRAHVKSHKMVKTIDELKALHEQDESMREEDEM